MAMLTRANTEEWRRDIDIRKTSLDEGAGAWSLSKLRTPQRKWIHNLTVGRKDAADMPYTTQVRKYRDFCSQVLALMAVDCAKFGTPIDMGKITEALLKAAGQLHRRQKLEEYRRMGEYWQYGQLRIARNFWYRAVMGYVGEDSGHIREEMEHLGLDMAPEGRYTMVYLRIDRGRMFEKDESKELCRFIIENILSQSLERREVMEDLMTYEDETDFYAAAFVNTVYGEAPGSSARSAVAATESAFWYKAAGLATVV